MVSFKYLIGFAAILAVCGVGNAQQAANSMLKVDIPAQRMADALNEFARQSGQQVLVDWKDADDLKSHRVSGTFTPQAVIERLLADSGLRYEYLDARTISIRPARSVSVTKVPQDGSGSMAPGAAQPDAVSTSGAGVASSVVRERIHLAQANGSALSPATGVGVREADGARLEEIVVTAQKRVENLQQVPVSAQVIGSRTLAEQNQNSFASLTQTVPSLHIGDAGTALFLRGIGSGDNASFDQSVAMFTDDIYKGRGRMSLATFLDLDRIEVLKGPQSIFFGNNAIAGAVNVVTKKPGDSFDGLARALYGMHGQYAVEGAVGGPINDALGVRLAVTRNGDDRGWIDNVNTGQRVPIVNNLGGRLTLVFKPIDDLDAALKIEGSQQRLVGSSSDQPLQISHNCPPPTPIPSGFGDIGLCPIATSLGVPMGLEQNKVSQLGGQFIHLSTFEDVLTVNYRQWGQAFTSVSGFYNYHFDGAADGSHLPVFRITGTSPEKYHQFSQELRVASGTGGRLEYIAGAYFQTDQLASHSELTFPFVNGAFQAFFPELDSSLPIAAINGFTQGERVGSVFGSLTWNVTDRLKASGGLRQSWVRKDQTAEKEYGTGTQLYGGYVQLPPALEPLPGLLFGNPPGITPTLNSHDRALMPSARVQYQLDPEAMLYFRYERGFKAGGFNGASGFGPTTQLQFGPEHVNAYELGLKSTWLDDTVSVNLDVFRSDYADLQANALEFFPISNGYGTIVRNAAQSRSQGVELETQWAVTKDLRVSADVTYLDSYYVSYPNATSTDLQQYCGTLAQAAYSATPQCAAFPFPVKPYQNLAGRPTDFAPKVSGSVNARYTWPAFAQLKLTTELSPYFTTAYFLGGSVDEPLGQQGAYVRLDGRVTLEPVEGRWAVDLIGKNLTNHVIITSTQLVNEVEAKQEPWNVAVQFRYHY